MIEGSTPSADVAAIFDEAVAILSSTLDGGRYHPPEQSTPESDLAAAVLLHALSARDDARAVVVLARASLGHSLTTHVRTIFEARAKMIWLTKDTDRATRLFQSEPFERYWLASKYAGIKKRPVWKEVLAACAAGLRENPTLAVHQKGGKSSTRPDYLAIARALRIPDMETLLDAIDEKGDAYTEDFLLDSLTSHVSIVHLKDFPKGINADGSLQFDTAASRDFVDRYLLKTIRWLLQITLMASVALATKDALMPVLTEFDGRIGPIFDRYNAA